MTVAVDIDDRIDKCRKILDSDPNSQIFAALAEAYRKKGELDKAFRICQSGLKIHPSYGSAHLVMAKINLDRGLYDWAEAEVERTVEIDGRSRAVELLLAEIYIYKGDYEAATKLLRNLLKNDPDNAQIKRLLDIARRLPEERKQVEQIVNRPREQTTKATEAPTDPEVQTTERMSPKDMVREATTIPGMDGALFINDEGLVVESSWSRSMDATTCGAVMAEVRSFLNQELMKASFGSVGAVLIEAGDLVCYMLTVAEGLFIFVGDGDTNLGTLRMRIGGLMERYQGE